MPTSRASLSRVSSNVTSYAESPSSDDESEATTRPAKRARAASAEDSDNDEADYDPSREAKNKAKKAKQARKSEAKPDGVDRFSRLPLNALFEIFSHVYLDDLLLLRQTSKSLYRLLSGPDGAAVWSRFLAKEGLPVLEAGLLKPWQYTEMALCRRCTSCTKPQFIPDFYVLRRHCRKCRKETMFRLTHLKKNYPRSHPCTKLCVLESHFRPGRLTYEVDTRHAFRADYETLDEYLWSLQAQDDADSGSRPAGSQTVARKATIKKGPDAPSPGPRVAKFVKERQRMKKLVKQDAQIVQYVRVVTKQQW